MGLVNGHLNSSSTHLDGIIMGEFICNVFIFSTLILIIKTTAIHLLKGMQYIMSGSHKGVLFCLY